MAVFIFLNKIGLVRPNINHIRRWSKRKNIENLCYAFDHGIYNIRIEIAKVFGELKDKRTIPLLRKRLKDEVKTVAIESANSLNRIGISNEIEKEITEMHQYWNRKELEAKEKNKVRNIYIPKWKKRDWVAILKKQLQKPMR